MRAVARAFAAAACCAAICVTHAATAGVQPVDTWMKVDPAKGSAKTAFTATLNYSPRSAACPPSTQVEFTWDGYALGSSELSGGVAPCRASITVKPLAGHVAAGGHQVCGKFATHKGCAPFTIESAAPAGGGPSPGGSTYTRTYASTYTVTTTTRARPRTPSGTPGARPRSSGGSPGAIAPQSDQGGGLRAGPIAGAAAAIVLAFGIRALVWSRRRASHRV